MELVVGTAGHIDHGKTTLIRALTGVDTDRLPEEKQRGITIDLGFAALEYDGIGLSFVDVPGHERFVKNMLAGASGIDAVMLVIAADDGVMPQTREHFDICRLLGISKGIIVLTKCDLADGETRELAKLEISELVAGTFLDGAPIIECSARSGKGVDNIKKAIAHFGRTDTAAKFVHESRMSIDRSFSVKGFGTVVTGTLGHGRLKDGDELELLPRGTHVRVRGLQRHDRDVEFVENGERAAVNLSGIDHNDVARGMTLAARRVFEPSQILDVSIETLSAMPRPLTSRQRIRLHIGTSEVLARITVVNSEGKLHADSYGFAQLRLEGPVIATCGDRFVIRSYSPAMTIGGGRVLEPFAVRYRRSNSESWSSRSLARAECIDDNSALIAHLISIAGKRGISIAEIRSRTGISSTHINKLIGAGGTTARSGNFVLSVEAANGLAREMRSAIDSFHARFTSADGIPLESLRNDVFRGLPDEVFEIVIGSVSSDGEYKIREGNISSAEHIQTFSSSETEFVEKLFKILTDAAGTPPKVVDAAADANASLALSDATISRLIRLLVGQRRLVRVSPDYYYSPEYISKLENELKVLVSDRADRSFDVAEFKSAAGVSRKHAIPLLEYLDTNGVTRRLGDRRIML